MMQPLVRLTDAQIASANILFLARFAPPPASEPPPPHPDHGIFPRYNYELYQTLCSLGLRVTPCDDLAKFLATASSYNYVFTIYNRAPLRNCEVFVPTLCEYFHLPYLGAPPNIRALAEDKYLTKILAASVGIPVAPGRVYRDLDETRQAPDFAGPYFVKPRFGASSEEVSADSVQPNWDNTRARVIDLIERGKECLVERCIAGTDVTVPVLGGHPPIVLPCGQEISELLYGVATYRQKRLLEAGRSRRLLDDSTLCTQLADYSRTLCEQVRPFDYLRVDFRLEAESQKPYLLEFNVACNLGSHAAIAQAAEHIGIGYPDLIGHVLGYSLQRQSKPPCV